MDFSIRNFRGCVAADISVSNIALLAGDGGASKTSILQAIQSVATGTEIPIGGVAKKDAKVLLHDGSKKASVHMEGENFSADIKWQSSKIDSESQGKKPSVSSFAAGLTSFFDLDAKQRALVLGPLIEANPTVDDLAKFLKGNSVENHQKIAERLWGSIDQDGWDTAHKQAERKRAELKGMWKQASGGETYGADKAEGWEPDGWSHDLDDATEESLTTVVAAAESTLEKAIAANAVSNIDRDDLMSKADQLESLTAHLAKVTGQEDAVAKKYRAWTVKIRPSIPAQCPHCDGSIDVNSDGTVSKSDSDVSPEDAKAAADEHDKEGKELKEKLDVLHKNALDLREKLASATQAKNKLAGMTETASDAGSVDDARHAVDSARKSLSLLKSKKECDKLHDQISLNQVFVDALAPSGVRYEVLKKALEKLNDGIFADLSKSSGWPKLRVTEEMDVHYDGRPSSLLCGYETAAAKYLMQVALAKLDGSELVVIDDTHDLRVKDRAGLFKMMIASGIKAVIAMMIDDPKKVPDLAKNGVGFTYWVESGEASPVSS